MRILIVLLPTVLAACAPEPVPQEERIWRVEETPHFAELLAAIDVADRQVAGDPQKTF